MPGPWPGLPRDVPGQHRARGSARAASNRRKQSDIPPCSTSYPELCNWGWDSRADGGAVLGCIAVGERGEDSLPKFESKVGEDQRPHHNLHTFRSRPTDSVGPARQGRTVWSGQCSDDCGRNATCQLIRRELRRRMEMTPDRWQIVFVRENDSDAVGHPAVILSGPDVLPDERHLRFNALMGTRRVRQSQWYLYGHRVRHIVESSSCAGLLCWWSWLTLHSVARQNGPARFPRATRAPGDRHILCLRLASRSHSA